MQLETSRLILRPWQAEDTQHLQTLFTDVGYTVFAPPGLMGPLTSEQAKEKIKQRQKQFQEKKIIKFVIFSKDSQELIGTCGGDPFTLDGKEEIEIGYRIRLDHWAKGYATEAARAATTYALTLKPKVYAFVHEQNKNSIKVLEKLGYQYQKEYLHRGIPHRLYSIEKPPLLKTLPTLTTKRLILRSLSLKDTPAIFSYAKNENVAQYTLWNAHKTLKDSENFITAWAFYHYSHNMPEPFGIAFKESPDQIIGTIGCRWVKDQSKSMEMDYALSEEHWNKGITTEAAQEVIKFCFQNYDLNRIQARCKAENIGSAKVMEKIGMQYEGSLREIIFHNNRYWDLLYYSTLRHVFLSRNG